MRIILGQKVKIDISRSEACFDRACDEAYQRALSEFDVDDCGHFNNVEKAQRSKHSISVKFVSYTCSGGMGGQSHRYQFTASVG